MTRSNLQSTTTIILLLFMLATIVQAHPTGSESFDPNGLSWAFAGEQVSSMLAHSQFAQITTSPMERAYYRSASVGPPLPSIPRSQPLPIPNTMIGYFAPFDFETMALTEGQSQAAQMQMHKSIICAPRTPIIQQDRCATPNSVHGMSHCNTHLMWNTSLHTNGQSISQLNESQCGPLAQTQLPFAEMRPGYVTGYGQPASLEFEPQGHSQHQTDDLEQLFPELDEPMLDFCQPVSDAEGRSIPVMPATTAPQMLSNENLGYHDSHMDKNASGHMRGWLGRASAAGEGSMLRVDTSRLAPPAMSDIHLSPSSASSAGSSTGRSQRRSKEEMVLGEISCSKCSAAFDTQGDLTHHLRSHAPYQSRSHVCTQCDKRFQYRKDLARHLPRHDPNRRRFRCHFSGCKYNTKGFGRQDHLDRHLVTQHRIDSPVQISRTPSSRTSS